LDALNCPQHQESTSTLLQQFRIPLQSRPKVMPRSQWICKSCGIAFETRGKRDSHHRKEHRKRLAILPPDRLNSSHSSDSTCTCVCGRRYQRAQALNRHQASCTRWDLTEQGEIVREHYDEGNISTL